MNKLLLWVIVSMFCFGSVNSFVASDFYNTQLVHYFPLNEVSGLNAQNYGVGQLNATANSSVWMTANGLRFARVNNSQLINSSNTNVKVGLSTVPNVTWGGHVRFNATNDASLRITVDSGSDRNYLIKKVGNNFSCSLNYGAGSFEEIIANFSVTNNTWYAVYCTYESGGGANNFKLYVNGTQVKASSIGGNAGFETSAGGIINIGGGFSGSSFVDVREVALWNVTLTSANISVLSQFSLNNDSIVFGNPTTANGVTKYFGLNNYVEMTVNATSTGFTNLTLYLFNNSGLYNWTFTNNNNNAYVNITGLPVSTYYFNATAQNSTGSMISTDTRSFSVSYVLLNVTARNFTGGFINGFNMSLNGVSFVASGGSLLLNISPFVSYVLSFNNSLYANYETVYVANDSINQYYSTVLYPLNSLFFQTYLESTGGVLASNLTSIVLVNNEYSYNLSTNNNGFGIIQGVYPGSYYVSFSHPSYVLRKLYLTVLPFSSQNVSVFLNNGTAILFNYKDAGATPIPGVLFRMYTFVNGVLTLVNSDVADSSGRVQFYAMSNKYYAFNSSKSGYNDYFNFYSQLLFTSYDIKLSQSSVGNITPSAWISFSPQSFVNGRSHNFSIIFVSPFGSLNSYQYVLTAPGVMLNGSGLISTGQIFVNNFSIPWSSVSQVVMVNYSFLLENGVSDSRSFTFYTTAPYLNKTLVDIGDKSYGMLGGDKIFWLSIILLVVMGVVWLGAGFEASLMMGGLVVFLLSSTGFITIPWIPLMSVLLAFIIMLLVLKAWGGR